MKLKYDKPFYPTRLEEERKKDKDRVISVKINKDWENIYLNPCKPVLQQAKDSTLIKCLAEIGAKVVLEENQQFIINLILGNKRRNKRIGISEIE